MKQAYWAAFAGGMHTYGNSNTWSFGTNPEYVSREWKEAVSSEGATCMSVYYSFFESINWWNFVPDQSVIMEGAGAEDSLNVAISSANKNQVVVYLSAQAAVKLDLNRLSEVGNITGEWINPGTGERRDAGNIERDKPVSVRTPSDWKDALLLIGRGH